ncbi:glycerophosphodiester phosphodiesterase family protein [Sphingobium sp. HBC34]|uniref:Glycerophosphodiester phosphodiesterase family protein n=1 Tax=Sphingobium cyanobacteriorum TaxID=3063954 RepID=A0ABT8ZN49_9SPHN|nr:glycerophosphodiester phosphodiesterase family protein [Sphingobium sp. HBC34]MDO7835948.1 glycerophosphodiester phosphodiesterase family protein [Sphingobium sp. HBC34]
MRWCLSGPKPDILTACPFAHRGLHGAGVSENGMAAFDAAIAAGYGIECDVRLSRDGVAFVFHDATLNRMAGRDGLVAMLDAAALDQLRLPDGGPVPRLSALLARCAGRTPLLVEIKADDRHVDAICKAVARDLDGWPGAPVAVMSFNPHAMRWFVKQRVEQLRGLVVTQQGKGRMGAAITRALALWLAKPDFVACDVRDLPSPLSRRARRQGWPVLTWTVRSDADRARAAAHADQIIFEAGHD